MYKNLVFKVKENNIYKLLKILYCASDRRKRQLYFLFVPILGFGYSQNFIQKILMDFYNVMF